MDPRTFERLTRVNIIPDNAERLAEIGSDPVAYSFFAGVNLLVGEGHNQYVDDAFTSHDGRFLYVSRPSFADVVGIELATRRIVWRVVHAIDTASGRVVGEFDSGSSPHENNYSADGSRIFHASTSRWSMPARCGS